MSFLSLQNRLTYARLMVFYICLYPFSTIAEIPIVLNNDLKAGKILITKLENKSGTPGLKATFVVKASRAKIWSALTNYQEFRRFFPNIKQLRTLSQSHKGATIDYIMDTGIMDIKFVLDRQYTTPEYELRWKMLRGDVDDIEGSWLIKDTDNPGKKLLIYTTFVDINVWIINWIARQFAISGTRDMANNLRAELEKSSD